MRKQVNILLIASLVASMVSMIPASKVSAATVSASFTKVQANSNSTYLEFSVPMVDSDVLFKSGFESGDTKFTTTWTGEGNQSYVSTGDAHGTALQLTNTVSPESGNFYDPGLRQTSSKYSMAQIKIPSLRSNSKFSVQYDLKTVGNSAIFSFFGDLRKEQPRNLD